MERERLAVDPPLRLLALLPAPLLRLPPLRLLPPLLRPLPLLPALRLLPLLLRALPLLPLLPLLPARPEPVDRLELERDDELRPDEPPELEPLLLAWGMLSP